MAIDDYEIKEAARTIIRSQELMQDKRMMKRVAKELKAQARASQSASNMVSGHKSDYMHPTVSAPVSRSRGR